MSESLWHRSRFGGSIKGPAEPFTGDVWFDVIAKVRSPRMRVNMVRFAPCARTPGHSHPVGQTLHVTEGCDLVTDEEYSRH